MVIGIAREAGVSGYVGDGANVWPAVNRSDAARAFRLALEQPPPGSVCHAVGEEGVATRTIADVIGRHLHMPVVSIAPEDVGAHFGWMGLFWSANLPTSSALTRERLGWHPVGPGLIEDLEEGHYFSAR
jgi:nucleoside-diphosphate-sugar epimerase